MSSDTLDYTEEYSVIEGKPSLRSIDDVISKPLDTKPDKKYYIALAVTLSMMGIGGVALLLTFYYGTGLWGNNNPVGWGLPIVNFVFWVGIGHAGTLISAVLFLFRQKWRTAVNRSAEAMTLIAVMCAGIFPLIHMGRPWLAFWMMPYPNTPLYRSLKKQGRLLYLF